MIALAQGLRARPNKRNTRLKAISLAPRNGACRTAPALVKSRERRDRCKLDGERTKMTKWAFAAVCCASFASAALAETPSPATIAALRGLAPVTALANTENGRAALAANFSVTGGIQTGAIRQPTLRPFAEQQQQALRDAFIAFDNLADLSDGLGTTLGAAYLARAHYDDRKHFTSVSKPVADLIFYAERVALSDAGAGKFFFANGMLDGKTPPPAEAAAILQDIKGAPDPFGRAYNRLAGSPGADRYGNSRPFQTEPFVTPSPAPIISTPPPTTISTIAAR